MLSATTHKELIKATGINKKEGEDIQKYLDRLAEAVSDLEESKWDDLSIEAQSWYDDATDAVDEGNPIKAFDDLSEEKEPEKEHQSGKKKDSIDAKDVEVGMQISVDTKNDTFEGTVSEVSARLIILKTNEGEERLRKSRIESITEVEDSEPEKEVEPEKVKDLTSSGEVSGVLKEMSTIGFQFPAKVVITVSGSITLNFEVEE